MVDSNHNYNDIKMTMKFFWCRHWQWSQSNPWNHHWCKSGTSNKKVASFLQQQCQWNHHASYKRKKCYHIFKFFSWSGYGNQWNHAVPKDPKTFNIAWDHPHATSCAKWWEWICKELANMNMQQVRHMTSKSLMPPNCRYMKNKWVFKIKHNDVYWGCLVVWGYIQIPSVDFSKNYSLVVNDITFCILLLMVLNFGYSAKIAGTETTFLYGDLEEEMYMECPQGMSNVRKGWLCHSKQVHLQLCSSSMTILQKGHQDFNKFRFLEAVLTHVCM